MEINIQAKVSICRTFVSFVSSSSQASLMTLRLENAQIASLRAWENEFYAGSKSYIDIMPVESAVIPSRDAGLMISWQEVSKRALTQEAFVKQYPNSNRTINVTYLYQQYVISAIYELNNTPLFDYVSKEMDPEAKETYLSLLAENTTTNSV